MKFTNIFFPFLAILLSSCSLSNNEFQYQQVSLNHSLADKSYLTKEPCESPCWYGVELGKTTLEETLAILQGLDFVERDKISVKGDTHVGYQCVYETPGNFCGHVFFSDGVAFQIVYFVAFPLYIEDVLRDEGFPKYVYTDNIGADGCILSLAWPDKNLVIEYRSNDERPCDDIELGKKIIPGYQVTYIWYEDLGQIDECSFSGIKCLEWPGFSQISE